MAKYSSKIANAAHIKERTKGTSNEVSFSVLHAKANALDGKKDDIEAPRFNRWNPFRLAKGIKRGSLTERSTPVTPSSPVESAIQAASKTKQNDPLLSLKPGSTQSLQDSTAKKASGFSVADALGSITGLFAGKGRKKTSFAQESLPKPKRSFEEEIAVRKARRKQAKIMAIATVCVAVACFGAAGAWYGYGQYKSYQGSMGELEQALGLVQEADETVLNVDSIVVDPFGAVSIDRTGAVVQGGSLERVSSVGDPVSEFKLGDKEVSIDASVLYEAMSSVDDACVLLDEADLKARSASESLQSPEDKEAANQTIIGIAARKDMLLSSVALLEPVQSAVECIEVANIAWEKMMLGDDLARQASGLLGNASVEEVQASKAKNEEALTVFLEARDLYTTAASLFAGVDFSLYQEYLDKRIQALEHAIASDAALIDRNKEEAASRNDAYLSTDAEAVELAKRLPSNPDELVLAAYEEFVASTREQYDAARLQAGNADAALRDYLGIGAK